MHASERTKAVIAHYMDMEAADLSAETHLFNDIHLDSLGRMEVIIALENAFSIEIEDQEVDDVFTVQDAIDLVEMSVVR